MDYFEDIYIDIDDTLTSSFEKDDENKEKKKDNFIKVSDEEYIGFYPVGTIIQYYSNSLQQVVKGKIININDYYGDYTVALYGYTQIEYVSFLQEVKSISTPYDVKPQ